MKLVKYTGQQTIVVPLLGGAVKPGEARTVLDRVAERLGTRADFDVMPLPKPAAKKSEASKLAVEKAAATPKPE
jgi:DNA-binding transcriptional regulator LsrR (DeoR family)